MGAGAFPAGLGPAGADPVYVAGPVVPPVMPRALKFDPQTRRFIQNADGSMADVHPVDQQVVFVIFFEKGSIPSQPTLGTRIRARTERCDPNQKLGIALDETRQALAKLISAGDVRLISVVADNTFPARGLYAITYVNLRDPNTNILTPLLNAVTVVA